MQNYEFGTLFESLFRAEFFQFIGIVGILLFQKGDNPVALGAAHWVGDQ